MPTVPMTPISGRNLEQIPEVMSAQPRFAAAYGALGEGMSDFGKGTFQAVKEIERAKDVRARDEARDALTQYTSELNGVWGGSVDPATGEGRPGLKQSSGAEAEGAARRLGEWQRGWRDNPDGSYAKLSPDAKKYFDPEAQGVWSRYGSLALDHEFDQTQALKAKAREAFLVSQEEMAGNFHFDGAKFAEAAPAAARAMAAAKVGAGLLNPGETDPARLRFAKPEFAALYDSEYRDASDALNFDRAKTLLSSAKTLGDDGMAGERVGVAREIAKGLSPKLQAAAGELAADAEGYRSHVKAARASAEREADARRADAMSSAVGAVELDYHRGKFKTPDEAFAALDTLASAGAEPAKVLAAREKVVKMQDSSRAAAELSANPSTWADNGKDDTLTYLGFKGEVARGDAPWRTEERLLAAARSKALTKPQFEELYDTNRKGVDEREKKAVAAALAAAAELDAGAVVRGLDSPGDAAGAKARAKLTSSLRYDYGLLWNFGRKTITSQEFDDLVSDTRRFIQANPDKDAYRDFVKPLISPKVAAARAVELSKRLSLNPENSELAREAGYYKAVGGMVDKPMSQRQAVSKAFNAGSLSAVDAAREERVSRMAAGYEFQRKEPK